MAEIVGAHFGLYHPDEIVALSLKKVVSPDTVDTLGNPVPGGLCDRTMGTADVRSTCTTCNLGHTQCPGHMGHLELASPVYNPMTFTTLRDLIFAKCFNCHHFKTTDTQVAMILAKLTLIDAGLVNEALEMENAVFSHPVWDDLDDTEQKKGHSSVQGLRKYTNDAMKAHGCKRSIWRQQTSHVNEVRTQEVSTFLKSMKTPKCPRCESLNDSIKVRGGFKLFLIPRKRGEAGANVFGDDDGEEDISRDMARYLPPIEVEKHMKLLWDAEKEVIQHLFSSILFKRGDGDHNIAVRKCDPSMFFLRILAVPPNRFRPANVLGGQIMENEQTVQYQEIMKENLWLASMTRSTEGEVDMDSFMRSITRLQYRVGMLIDSHSVKDLGVSREQEAASGIRQILEKKEGLFRMHMMGKRVNYSARSVISPDPNIDTSEIGVPVHFAMKLSYPQPVTATNVEQMRKAVINGKQYPGANYVVDPDGTVIQLENRTYEQRLAISRTLLNLGEGPNPAHGHVYCRKVGRHLMDGDILLVNRQPTLHKPSIMAHRARILPGDRVIRMHYANCATYNADFDGDEINLHFPQSELARADGYFLASTEQQYCVPSSGMPIRGLIQDHVVGGVLLSKRGVFFTRHDYMQLVYAACIGLHDDNAIEPLPPAIMKPQCLWSGKQVVTTVLRYVTLGCNAKLNLVSKARVKGTAWQPNGPTHEDVVIFRESALLTGVMDRSQFGATAYGLVHAVNELYGPSYSEMLLTSLGRLFTRYLQMTGFTMGIDDCLVANGAEKKRYDLLSNVEVLGVDVSKKFCGNDDSDKRIDVAENLTTYMVGGGQGLDARGAKLDGAYRSALNPVASEVVGACIPLGQVKPFPANNLALMTVSGAKGSAVNHSQIACLLGQQDVDGRRVPRMINGKTLPCFLPYDPSPRSGGFITHRFLTGLELPEYYFHCMAGREGLIDTAVKTSSSGYLQRCLIKHLESIRIHYDGTVRQEDGSIVQFLYGEDGLDVTKTPWLKPEKLGFVAHNYAGFLNRLCVNDAASRLDEPRSIRKLTRKALKGKIDPLTSTLNPATNLGVTSESFSKVQFTTSLLPNPIQSCENYITTNTALEGIDDSPDMKAADRYRMLMSLKYMRSLAQPGESVGLLAAQSVGEPSTQMTLNTFHLAGVAEAKVTLGIPRLREILMTATRKLSAPSMTMPMHAGSSRQDALRVAAQIDRITLNELVDEVSVVESILAKPNIGVVRDYRLKINFKELDMIKHVLNIKWSTIRHSIVKRFLPPLLKAVMRHLKLSLEKRDLGKEKETVAEKKRNVESAHEESDSDDSDVASDDDDATRAEEGDARATMRRRMHGNAFYNADEEEIAVVESFYVGEAQSDDDEDDDMASTNYTGVGEHYLESLKFFPSGRCHVLLRMSADIPRILMMEYFNNAAEKTVVRHEESIDRCHIITATISDGSERAAIQTDGVNLEVANRLFDVVDVREVTCNSIHDVLETYGVEAARASLVREVSGVFGMYGINVDKRHLSLISDYCMHEGTYKGFNRTSMHLNPSPFTRMSFETSSKFLTAATVLGESDSALSASSCIVVGRHAQTGSGACDVRVPIVM